MTIDTLLKKILEFLSLQSKLSSAFIKMFPISQNKHGLLDVPKHGVLNVKGTQWNFTKHGAGISFSRASDGLIVDIHEHLEKPYLFDAWRLIQFLDFFQINLTEGDCIKLLQKLVQDKKLTESQDFYHYFSLDR